MNPILMGLPDAGKEIQAEKVIDAYGIPYISTGDMFRAAMQNETTLGLEARSYMDKGTLVPGEVADGIVKERLAEPDTEKGFLSGGSPCTLDQAEALDAMLKDLNKKADAVIDIHASEEILIERLAGRFICSDYGAAYHKIFNPTKTEDTCDRCGGHEFYQREDDRPKTVKNRLTIDIKNSESVSTYYKEQGLLSIIGGTHEINVVLADVQKIIEKQHDCPQPTRVVQLLLSSSVNHDRICQSDFQRILYMIYFESFEVGTAVPTILSCEDAKQV